MCRWRAVGTMHWIADANAHCLSNINDLSTQCSHIVYLNSLRDAMHWLHICALCAPVYKRMSLCVRAIASCDQSEWGSNFRFQFSQYKTACMSIDTITLCITRRNHLDKQLMFSLLSCDGILQYFFICLFAFHTFSFRATIGWLFSHLR